jgi:hypothetical protein
MKPLGNRTIALGLASVLLLVGGVVAPAFADNGSHGGYNDHGGYMKDHNNNNNHFDFRLIIIKLLLGNFGNEHYGRMGWN